MHICRVIFSREMWTRVNSPKRGYRLYIAEMIPPTFSLVNQWVSLGLLTGVWVIQREKSPPQHVMKAARLEPPKQCAVHGKAPLPRILYCFCSLERDAVNPVPFWASWPLSVLWASWLLWAPSSLMERTFQCRENRSLVVLCVFIYACLLYMPSV